MLSSQKLVLRIKDFVRQRGSCLFAGAGVGKRAGLPSWDEYLDHLATVAGRYEKGIEAVMRKRWTAGLYLESVELYKSSVEIPIGVKYNELATPFTYPASYAPDKLHSIMSLPFSAVVTTNYDRSLIDAYCTLFERQKESGLSLRAPKLVELGDVSMQHAVYWTDFYIARIHGRAEIPETIVLDRNDYLRTEKDPTYQDFLLNTLKDYRCLFVGYSFVDPAISRVLDLMSKTLPPSSLKLHMALLPNDCQEKLRYELAKYNIEVIEYDSTREHEMLWESIKLAQREIRTLPRKAPDKIESLPGLSRFIASCYARIKIGTKSEPLREIVMEGIVAQTIVEAGSHGITKRDVVQSIKKYISLTDDQLEDLVTRSVNNLLDKKLCIEKEGNLECKNAGTQIFDSAMETLVKNVVNRLKVREGVDAEPTLRSSIAEVLNQILLTRGWDLGAHFAGGHAASTFEAWPQIKNLIEHIARNITSSKSTAVANAIFDLFRHPEDSEAELLADVGRIAFAVELVLSNARSTLQLFFIPETIYLDANVLMPAIVEGHPYSPVYTDAISRMLNAARSLGTTVRIFTAREFLNEIIHHRNLAIQEVHDQGLEDTEKLRHHILIYGSENTNVYIGAYASFVGRGANKIPFADFLRKVAPYKTEEALGEFLQKHGIEVITLSFNSSEDKRCFNDIKKALHEAYERKDEFPRPKYYIPKPTVLIDHEAAQLARIILDLRTGRKPLFVTADKRLMELCCGEILGRGAGAIVSRLGFIQLIDLIFGIETDKRSLARLLWSVDLTDEQTVVRNYLIDLALQHYDDAQAMAMWEVVDRISEEAVSAAKREGIVIFPRKEENRARTAAFLDRFEQDFFKKMAEVIRKREKESAPAVYEKKKISGNRSLRAKKRRA